MAIATDELFLRQALALAAQGTGLASPNPLVGALIVDERGRIVGSGMHTYAAVKHAEVLAIEQAGPLARGNTLYLNLEPCSHTGRTGPCADAVIAAGIARVVCSMEDPNPLVAGNGLRKLREAGIEVAAGCLQAEARRLNESFARYIRSGVPLVTLKAAMSLDGKIAVSHAGAASTTYITNEASRRRVHRMRHASDAILVGIGTILADDPMLTDRSGLPRRRPLLRAILDSQLRLPLTARVVESANDDVVVFCCLAEENKRRALEARGVRVRQVPIEGAGIVAPEETNVVSIAPASPAPHQGRPDLHEVVIALGAEQIASLLVEGGAAVNWAFLRTRLVDKLTLFFTPRIFGPAGPGPAGPGPAGSGPAGTVPWLAGEGTLPPGEELIATNLRIERFDEDFAIEATLRDPYTE